jgi:predicted transcriptional regulator
MPNEVITNLSRRERQIMDAIYRLGRATVQDVLEQLPDPPSYSAVRALMRVLEEKEYVKHIQDGPRYVFYPTISREKAKKSALKHLLTTFFNGSLEDAVAALITVAPGDVSNEQLDRLAQLIEQAKKQAK